MPSVDISTQVIKIVWRAFPGYIVQVTFPYPNHRSTAMALSTSLGKLAFRYMNFTVGRGEKRKKADERGCRGRGGRGEREGDG